MKTLKKVEIKPVYVDYIPALEDMEEAALYISKKYTTSSHRCLCGCGQLTVTPLTEHGWTLTERDGKVSLQPSISNYQIDCRSHYILTNNVANFV